MGNFLDSINPVSAGADVLSTLLGGYQLIDANQKRQDARGALGRAKTHVLEQSDIPSVATEMMAARDRYRRKSAALSTGVEYRNELDTMRSIAGGGFKNTLQKGGSTALLSRLLGGTMNQALAKGGESERFYETLFTRAQEGLEADKWKRFAALNQILSTKRNLELADYSQSMGESVTQESAGWDNLLGGGLDLASQLSNR